MSIAGIILAAGQSKRMGKDKASLIFNERCLIDHAAKLLEDAGFPLYISGQNNKYACIPDMVPFNGPLHGIYNCIQQLNKEHIGMLVFPVDMPFLTNECVLNLVEKNHEYDVIYYQGHCLPLYINFTSSIIEDAEENILSFKKGKSIQSFINRHHKKELPLSKDAAKIFTNVNTPQEWQSALNSKQGI